MCSFIPVFNFSICYEQKFAEKHIARTLELRQEKKKSDRLLFQMLPPPVVKQLKQQRQVTEPADNISLQLLLLQ